ncbi:MAG TPA: ABC transporter permease, partial [Polyangiaceae bacterium]|nr:ABC transporter permease [Polyangiaceae bacterium]
MNSLQTIAIALRAILSNKLRAMLTTLGIVIGVAAVIAMMAVGAGAKAQVQQAFAAMGTNILVLL